MWFATSARICSVSSLEKRSRRQIAAAIRVPTSAWPLNRMRSLTVYVGGLPTSCSSAPHASVDEQPAGSFSSSSSVCTHTSPSGCHSGGCATPRIAATSGSTRCSNPVASSILKASAARPSVSIRVSSSRVRSRLTWPISCASTRIAAKVSRSMVNPKRAANRTARSMRSLSSVKRRIGFPIARTTPAARSSRPPT